MNLQYEWKKIYHFAYLPIKCQIQRAKTFYLGLLKCVPFKIVQPVTINKAKREFYEFEYPGNILSDF